MNKKEGWRAPLPVSTLLKRRIDTLKGTYSQIDHLMRRHGFARMMGEMEGLPRRSQYLLEVTALCVPLGSEGDSIVPEKFLDGSGLSIEDERGVLYLSENYRKSRGLEAQILREALLLSDPGPAELDERASAYFETTSGRSLFKRVSKAIAREKQSKSDEEAVPIPETEPTLQLGDGVALRGLWGQIRENLDLLTKYENPDDQPESERVLSQIEELKKMVVRKQEPWVDREEILRDIVDNGFYASLGWENEIQNLMDSICSSKEERLLLAQLEKEYSKHAAKIWRAYSPVRFIEYAKAHLDDKVVAYWELIDSYEEQGNLEVAQEVDKLGSLNRPGKTGFRSYFSKQEH